MKNLLVSVLVAMFGCAPLAQNSGAAAAPSQDKQQCVIVLRNVNTAEMQYRAANHHFGTVVQLLSSGDLESRFASLFDNPSLATKFRVFVSPDGASYEISGVHRDSDRSWGCVSNEAGVIYLAEPIR